MHRAHEHIASALSTLIIALILGLLVAGCGASGSNTKTKNEPQTAQEMSVKSTPEKQYACADITINAKPARTAKSILVGGISCADAAAIVRTVEDSCLGLSKACAYQRDGFTCSGKPVTPTNIPTSLFSCAHKDGDLLSFTLV